MCRGKPTLFATTKQFLDYFNLEKLSDLPPLGDLKEISALAPELAFEEGSNEEGETNVDELSIAEETDTNSNTQSTTPDEFEQDSDSNTHNND